MTELDDPKRQPPHAPETMDARTRSAPSDRKSRKDNAPVKGPIHSGGRVVGRPAANLVTRREVAAIFDVSVNKIRRLEGVHLHPVKHQNAYFFKRAEVDALSPALFDNCWSRRGGLVRRTAEGADAALVFTRLDQRQSIRQIVIETHIVPSRVRALHREWLLAIHEERLGQLRLRRFQQASAAPAAPSLITGDGQPNEAGDPDPPLLPSDDRDVEQFDTVVAAVADLLGRYR